MDGIIDHIEDATTAAISGVCSSGKHLQLVLMSLAPGEDIGEEVHKDGDQFFRFEEGSGVVTIDGRENEITDGDGIVIPAGARHNIKNAGEKPLNLYTRYGPQHHRGGYSASTKVEAEAAHEEIDGRTTEG